MDICLLLDLFGSMVGELFNEMMVVVWIFVEGRLNFKLLKRLFKEKWFYISINVLIF